MREPGALHRWIVRGRRPLALLLLAASVLVPATAFAQQGNSPRRRSAACSDCVSEAKRLKLLERLDSLQWKFEHEKLTSSEREHLRKEMSLAIRELQSAIGALRVEMGDLERAQAEAWAQGPRMAYTFSSAPHGYLGVSFDGPNTDDFRHDERVIRFYAYPRIALVEPSSPADRAGIRAGDTLVALNGVDVLDREISLTKMLVPDEQLAMRLRREGSTRDVRVTVARAPAYVVQRWTPMAPMPAEAPGAIARVRVPAPARVQGAPGVPAVAPAGQSAVTSVWVYSDGVAGAKVETVTEGLSKAIGVRGGVLVLRAGPGTPANEAGLRDGDVITKAAGVPVSTVSELRAALERSGSRSVRLVILREKKERELTLRQ